MGVIARLVSLFGDRTKTREALDLSTHVSASIRQVDFGWMLPNSEQEKLSIAGKNYADVVDDYLWYELGRYIEDLSYFDLHSIREQCFVEGGSSHGDIRLDLSIDIPGNPIVLRLRGKLRLFPSLLIQGRYCPLYRIGYFGGRYIGNSPSAINFHQYWNPGHFPEVGGLFSKEIS